jgi:predicted DNA-binding transcriptional regulator AlpA
MGPFVDEKRLAELLAVSLAALRRWRYAGVGPKSSKFGASVRYAVSDVEAWIASRPTGGGTSC